MRKLLVIVIVLLASTMSNAQTEKGTIKGRIYSSDGQAAMFVPVGVKGTKIGIVTDHNGNYELILPEGKYTLQVKFIGHEPEEEEVEVKAGETIHVTDFKLREDSKELQEVQVVGKSETEIRRDQSYNVDVIDTKKLHNATGDLNQVLNQSTGIRVRENGGMGSAFTFMLNGFTGKQVKFFLDGVPMTNFGSSLSLNNLPVNVADRVEVYKGVVPIELGSDALGGAVNIITNQGLGSYVDASYSYGSFNTHRASVNVRMRDSSGFTVNANMFANYSDNSYKIEYEMVDKSSGQFLPRSDFKRFHDRYKSATAMFEVGVTGKKYADKLMIGAILSGNDMQVQNGTLMRYVYGQVFRTNQTIIPTLRYKKDNLFVKGLSLSAFASYNITEDRVVDTSSRKYTWDGSYTYNKYGSVQGEMNDYKSIYVYGGKDLLTTTSLHYDISKNHSFGFNHTMSNYERKETDKLNPDRLGLISPTLQKYTLGLGYKLTALNKKLTTNVFGKLYYMSQKIYMANLQIYNTRYAYPGYGIATSYFILPWMQAKASFEDARRMPESEELYGNGTRELPNPLLKPEHSKNVNIGIRIRNIFFKHHDFAFEVGAIYRKTSDLILPYITGGASINKNMDSTRVAGLEAGIKYGFKDFVLFEINGTYQDIVDIKKYGNSLKNENYLERIPNIPFLFGNANLQFKFKRAAFNHANMNVGYSCNYVEEFPLYWRQYGYADDKRTIPTQYVHNVSLTYSLFNGRYNVSLECRNLTDTKMYDFFRIQKPGRSFNVKLRYYFNK